MCGSSSDDATLFYLLRRRLAGLASHGTNNGRRSRCAAPWREPPLFFRQKTVAARLSNQVVKPAVHFAGLLNEAAARGRLHRHQTPQVAGQGMQFRKLNAPASRTGRLALQGATHLTDFTDLFLRNATDDGAAVGQQVDDADASQGNQRLADGRMADAEAFRQFLRHQMRAWP
jgi:hypothetical protein